LPPRHSGKRTGFVFLSFEQVTRFELEEGEQDQLFGDGDSQLCSKLARNCLRCALAITSAPHKRGTLIQAVGLIPHFVVDQDLIRQLMNNQTIRAETRELRKGCSLHRFSSCEMAEQRRFKRLS
jgi:hypothetical protein